MPNHIPDDPWTRKQVNVTDTAPTAYGTGSLDSFPPFDPKRPRAVEQDLHAHPKPAPDMRGGVAKFLRYAQRNMGENQR